MVAVAGQRKLYQRILHLRKVPFGDDVSFLVPSIQVRKLYTKETRLHFVQAGIGAQILVIVFLLRAVISEDAHLLCKFGVVCGDRAAVAKSAEILSGIETEPGGISQITGLFALVFRAVRLCGVLDNL